MILFFWYSGCCLMRSRRMLSVRNFYRFCLFLASPISLSWSHSIDNGVLRMLSVGYCNKKFFFFFFFGVPHSANFIFIIFVYVIASIASIHPVYGAGVRTHNLLIMSPLPLPLDHGSRLVIKISLPNFSRISFSLKCLTCLGWLAWLVWLNLLVLLASLVSLVSVVCSV